MPVRNVVITQNTTPQHTPYGAIDDHFTRIDDIFMDETAPDGNLYPDTRSLGPLVGNRYVSLIRAEDLHQIPSNAFNISARLYIRINGGFSNFDVESRRLLRYWFQHGASFNGNTQDLDWETPGALGATDRSGTVDDTTDVGGAEQYEFWDVSAAVAADIAGAPRENFGIGLYPVAGPFAFRAWDGSFLGTDGQLPELHITYETPEGGGAGGIVKTTGIIKTDGFIKSSIIKPSIIKSGGGGGANPVPTVIERKIYVFGHSLFTHTLFQANEFTTTGFSMGDLSRQSANFIVINQTFAQLRDQPLPPVFGSNFGFTSNQFQGWIDAGDAWEDLDWDDVLIMASNFEQIEKTPSEFADESEDVVDYIETNSPASRQIVYEHWAQPLQYGLTVFNTNELSPAEWDTYKELHRQGGAYHTWHLNYQDEIEANGVGRTIYMIPIGPIMMDALQTEAYLSSIEFADLMVDSAPHGNANAYFLAALVTYIAIFGEPASDFAPLQLSFLNTAITNNLSSLIPFISSRLAFYGANGVNLPPAI